MRIISQDLAQIHPRPTREELGDSWQPSVLVSPSAQFLLELSRGGWANPTAFPRGSVLRVAYNLDGDILVRSHWSVMDRRLETLPIRTELLTGVEEIEIRMRDANGEAHLGQWPPLNVTGGDRLFVRPRLIEFRINLDDFGWVWRSAETSG